MRKQESNVALFPERRSDALPENSAQVGVIVSISEDGEIAVEYPGSSGGVPARLAVPAARARVEAALAQRQQVVLVFEGGDRLRPLIVGFIEAIEPLAQGRLPKIDRSAEAAPIVEADVDGRRVRVTAQDEIVLECGSASITLRRNGRVVIRGAYVETHSEGTNRIKGGQVQIN
ncbi:MAG: DUF6484 domain-containing protein [Steroidobacter sp.]